MKNIAFIVTAAILFLAVDTNAQTPEYSHQAGFYNGSFQLTLSCTDEFPTIFATLNGTEPGPQNPDSFQVTSSIQIQSRAGDPNEHSTVPLNNSPGGAPGWIPPQSEVFKATTVTAACFSGNTAADDAITRTYFIHGSGSNRYSLPVFSIVTDPDNFFDSQTGIMVPDNFLERGDEWERKIHVEFFESDGTPGFSQNAGARVHGNFSRFYPQKSLRLYSRADYGTSRFEYKLFPNQSLQRFNRFMLRNSGNDWHFTMYRDGLIQKLYENIDIDTQDYRPAIVFINGEYWGIHNMRERYDRHYLNRMYGVDRENLDYLVFAFNQVPEPNDGDEFHYLNMIQFANQNNLANQANYDHISTLMDIDNYIDMLVLGVYTSNTDWPFTNVRVWRSRNSYDPSAGKLDGRFRWLINDLDVAFGMFVEPTHNNLAPLFETFWYNELFQALIVNTDFRNRFINRFADYMHTVFKPDHVLQLSNEFKSAIEPEIQEHIQRWNFPQNVNEWNMLINIMHDFISQRPPRMRNQLISQFNLAGSAEITLDVSKENAGFIKLNSILLAEQTDGLEAPVYPFTGNYFSGVPVTIEAIPNAGYSFVGWQGHSSSNPVISVDPAIVDQITAIFEESTFSGDDLNPDPFDLSSGVYHFEYWSPEEPELSFPDHMVFLQSETTDPDLNTEMVAPYFVPEEDYHEDDAANIGFPYALTRRTRINALGSDGISFINTGRGRDLGEARLAIDTRGANEVYVNFRAGTVLTNSRIYALRLQYRVGNITDFKDVYDAQGNLVEYMRWPTDGHHQWFTEIKLPAEAANQPYVQLRWKYHHINVSSGPRAELSLGKVRVYNENFVSVDDELSNIPEQWNLRGNYPNPFNPNTNITFDLPVNADVTIEVYNVVGQKVATLVNTVLQAGQHTVPFDASALASGVYLYRLTSREHSINLTGKMMLIK